MSCKTLKLNSCEIFGSTFSGRKFNFPNRDISQDTFTAKVKGFVLNTSVVINGVLAGNSVLFSKDSLSSLKIGIYVIEYWANFKGVANEMIALEEFLISTTPCACNDDSLVHDFILEFPNETIEYSVKTETTNIFLNFEDLTPEQIEELQKPALEVIEQTKVALAESILATTNANNATSSAIEATENAVNATTNANDKAQLALDASNVANEKAVLAENASVLANEKAQLADTAAQNANTATANYSQKLTEINTAVSGSNTATDSANQAAQSANSAAQSANTAAQTANNAKGWSPVLVLDTTTIVGKTLVKLSDWTGGTGTKPTLNVGMWAVGDGTYTNVAADAEDLRSSNDKIGTGMPNGVVTGSVGDIYTDSNATNGAIRWIKKTGDNTNTGWVVEFGDTGWVSLPKDYLLPGAWDSVSDGLSFRRVNGIVFMAIGDATLKESSYEILLTKQLPEPFTPPDGQFYTYLFYNILNGSIIAFRTLPSWHFSYGKLFIGPTTTARVTGMVQFITDREWPTTLTFL